MILTLEELKEIFPQHERVNSEELNKLVDGLYDNCSQYQDVYPYITDFIKESFLGPNFKDGQTDEHAKSEMVDYLYDFSTDRSTYNSWIGLVEDRFIEDKGQRRTYDEACHLAADKWCESIFGQIIQDNGAINENHGGGLWACVLGSALKENSMEGVTEEMVESARKELYEYYKGHCEYTFEDGHKAHVNLNTDYAPNIALRSVLLKAGLPEDTIRNICPWKTGIRIIEKDNSVVIFGYNKTEIT